MKVILTEKVPALGNVGEIVTVSQGYARNFLLPKRKAVVADESKQKQLENQKRSLAKKVEAEKQVATETKNKLDGLALELVRKVGANGKLFGSITTTELAKLLGEKGLDVERRNLVLETPIKAVGTFKVKAKLFSEVEASFTVKVEMDPNQAEEERKKQEAAAKRAAAKKAKGEEEASADASEEKKDEPLTEEQKLQKEADELLRS